LFWLNICGCVCFLFEEGEQILTPASILSNQMESSSSLPQSSYVASQHFLVAANACGQHPIILTSNGQDVTDVFQEMFEDAGSSLSCTQWITSSTVDNSIAFWAQGEGIGYLDLVKGAVDAPSGNAQHIGDEFSGVCQDGEGRFWTAVSSYGQTCGAVLDADGGYARINFGPRQRGGSGDDSDGGSAGRRDGSDDDGGGNAPIAMASLHPFSDEVVVACRESILRLYHPDGTESRTLQLPAKCKALGVASSCARTEACSNGSPSASVPRAALITVLVEVPPGPVSAPPPHAPAAQSGGKPRRMMKKVLREDDRQVIVISIDATSSAVLVKKTYGAAQLGQRGAVPVTLTTLPDGSVVVGMSEGAPLRIWPADQATIIAPLVPKDSPSERLVFGAVSFAAVAVSKEFLEDLGHKKNEDAAPGVL
jgi:hypothetical protein